MIASLYQPQNGGKQKNKLIASKRLPLKICLHSAFDFRPVGLENFYLASMACLLFPRRVDCIYLVISKCVTRGSSGKATRAQFNWVQGQNVVEI